VVAVALSIGLHEIIAGFARNPAAPAAPPAETVHRVTIARIETRPTPTPKPKPVRTPAPLSPVAPVHPRAASAAPRAALRREGAARPVPREAQAASDVAALPAAQDAEGAGTGQGAGSPGDGGTGSANAGAADGGNEPCGAVDFVGHGVRYDAAAGGFFVAIKLVVHFPDGHAESLPLDYPFYYASAAENPFSEQNRNNPAVPVVLQTPPPALAAGEPALLQYVVKHTAAEGFTLLEQCPGTSTTP